MDNSIVEYIMAHWHGLPWLNQIFRFITYLGDRGIIWIVLALVLMCIPKMRKIGIVITVSLVLEVLIGNVILKPIIARARPYENEPAILDFLQSIGLKAPSDPSFPSGHTGASFATAISLMLTIKKKSIPAIIIAVLIGFSRVFLCVHYLTDVLGGALLGSVIAIIVVLISKRIKKRV